MSLDHPLEFMQRLAALVPRPRLHLIRFHGVLAPNARLRPDIIPNVPVNVNTPSAKRLGETALCLVVLEATGGLETPLVAALVAAGVPGGGGQSPSGARLCQGHGAVGQN
jgi:hypothetical protein